MFGCRECICLANLKNKLSLVNQEEIASFDIIMNEAYQKSTAITKMKLTDWLDSPWDHFFEVIYAPPPPTYQCCNRVCHSFTTQDV